MRIKHNLILSVLFTSSMLVGCNVDNKPLLSTPITMLAPDKKEALTPPVEYDYSLRWLLHDYDFNDWYWGVKNNPTHTILKFDNGVEGVSGTVQKVFSWTYQYPLGTTYGALVLDMTIKSNQINYWASGHFGGAGWFWDTNTMIGTGFLSDFRLTNNSPYLIKMYIDNSSRGAVYTFYSVYNGYGAISGNEYRQQLAFYSSTYMGSFYLHPFSTTTLVSSENNILDALYFDVLSIPSALSDTLDDYYDMGYGQGFTLGFESKGNLEWLEDVATAVKDIFSVEIFPGMTVGFIVLFPLVIAIVKWFLSLFGIGGGS